MAVTSKRERALHVVLVVLGLGTAVANIYSLVTSLLALRPTDGTTAPMFYTILPALGDFNCLDYARHPCGDSPVSARCGRQGVQLRPPPPLRDGGRPRARGDDCVPGDVPHGLLARAQALARGIRGAGRAGPRRAVDAGPPGPVPETRVD